MDVVCIDQLFHFLRFKLYYECFFHFGQFHQNSWIFEYLASRKQKKINSWNSKKTKKRIQNDEWKGGLKTIKFR